MDAKVLDDLVDSYQTAINLAETRFGSGSESHVLVAAVVENARAARQRLVISVPGGDKLTARLDTFLAEAEKRDILGRLFAETRKYATNAGKSAMKWAWNTAIGVSAGPTAVAIVGAIVAATGVLHEVGRVIGAGVAVILIGVLALLLKNPGLASRTVVVGSQAAVEVSKSVGAGLEWSQQTFAGAVRTVDQLGRGATVLLDETVNAPARRFFGGLGALPGWSVAPRTRAAARGVLYSAVAVIVACLIFVGIGFVDGLEEGAGTTDPTLVPTSPTISLPGTTCITFADGTCL